MLKARLTEATGRSIRPRPCCASTPHRASSAWEVWCTPARSGVVLDPPLPQAVAALFGPYRMRKGSLAEPAAPFWVA
jgi:hypothetical protein